jgi:hypothetical protein
MRSANDHAGKNGIALNASSLVFYYLNNTNIATKISFKKVIRLEF